MSEPTETGNASGAAGPTPGELLQQERERRGLSPQQAAEGMHLETWVIEALESNRFDTLGAPVFARGHLRKYAALLGLPESQVLERYGSMISAQEPPSLIPASHGLMPTHRPTVPVWLLWLLLLALIGGLALWWWLGPGGSARVVQSQTTPGAATAAADRDTGTRPEPAARRVGDADETAAAASTSTEPAADAVPPAEAVPAPLGEQQARAGATPQNEPGMVTAATTDTAVLEPVRLVLEFTEQSWVEVTDASGRRLMFDFGQPGTTRALEGQAPLNVLLGFAPGVSLTVNGQAAVVPSRRMSAAVARFTVTADGSLE